jgi:hypothetical protein
MTKRTNRPRQTNTKAEPKFTAQQAAEVLQEETIKAQEAFKVEYEELCQKHQLTIVGIPFIDQEGKVRAQLQVGNLPME